MWRICLPRSRRLKAVLVNGNSAFGPSDVQALPPMRRWSANDGGVVSKTIGVGRCAVVAFLRADRQERYSSDTDVGADFEISACEG